MRRIQKIQDTINILESYRTPNRLDQKKILLSYNSQNTKCTKQRKNIKSRQGKKSSNLKRKIYQNYTRLLTRDYESQRSWAYVTQTLMDHKCQPRLQYPAKLSTQKAKTTFTQYLSRNAVLQRIIDGKCQHKEGKYTLQKARK